MDKEFFALIEDFDLYPASYNDCINIAKFLEFQGYSHTADEIADYYDIKQPASVVENVE